jgi:molecular chaperone DnaK
MGRAIGIDLGTTNSCAAVIENNQPTIIMYRGGSYTIPSLFAIDSEGQTLVGQDAQKQAALNPRNTIFAPKRMVGRDFHSPQVEKIRQLFTYDMVEGEAGEVLIKVKDHVLDLREISGHILAKIKEVAEEYLGEEVTDAVITVPAYFNDKQRQAVRSAGKVAGLEVLRILNEPTAAALAYGLGKNLRQRLAVYDLGGGTFDISIIEIRDKIFEVVATGGDTFLGGIDFDDRIIGQVIDEFRRDHGIDLFSDPVAIQRLREASERAKITLSAATDTQIEVPFIARGKRGILNVNHHMNRIGLEELVQDLVIRTISTCQQIFAEANLSPEAIDEVLLVGGQSRMPLVQQSVRTYFGREPCKGVHPDEAVAVGASIMAHSLTQALANQVTLLDVLPMPMGIARGNGSFLPLFPRNCPIPMVRKLTLTNSKDNQKTIMLKVFQGDSDIAAENEALGTFVFAGLRQLPKSELKVQVWLNVDSEGILTITAKDKETEEPLEVNLKLKQKDFAPTLTLGKAQRRVRKKAGAATPPRPAPAAPPSQAPAAAPPPPSADATPSPPRPAGDAAPPPGAAEDEIPTPAPIQPKPRSAAADAEQQAAPPVPAGQQTPSTEKEPGCLSLLLPWNWFS